MSKYQRDLTEEERMWISEMSVRSPRLAINLAETLKTSTYHIGGRLYYFTPPKAKDDTTPKAKKSPPKKRKRWRMPKWPKCTGTICGLEMLGEKDK